MNLLCLKRSLTIGFAVSALCATGCSNLQTTAAPTYSSADATISGHLIGGNQPISGADVRLYAAGATGYGSASTLYAETTSNNDGYGSFSFTKQGTTIVSGGTTPVYGCPTATNPQMYIIAKGGNTQGSGKGTNSAAEFIIALGPCNSIGAQTQVDLTETTTVATMAALQQYFAPASSSVASNLDQLGYPASTQGTLGFANAVSLIPNLVNTGNGSVPASSTLSATPTGSTTPVTVTVTPEQAKIDTLADIIAACVNTTSNSSSACTTLFTDAVPPSPSQTSQPALTYQTATNTVEALYYMLTNPTSGSASNLTALYALQTAASPFFPNETVAPTDWTVGLRYSSASPCTTGTANFLAYVYHLAIDASGDMYGVSNATGGNLFEVSPNGTPLVCNYGTTTAKSTSLTIDPSGNLYIGSTTTANILKISSGTSSSIAAGSGFTQFLTADGSGNIFYSPYNAQTGATVDSIFEIPSGSTTAEAIGSAGADPFFLAPDTKGNLYSTDSTTTNNFYQFYKSGSGSATNGFLTANFGSTTSVTNGYGVQAGLSGQIYTVNGNNSASTVSNTLTIFTPSTTTPGTATVTFTSAQYAGGLVGPRELAIDGAGNVWTCSSTATAGSYVNSGSATTLYAVNEYTAVGNAISPTGTGTSTTTNNGGFQKDASVLPLAPRSVAVDPSGNVWFGTNSSTGTGVLVLVGAGVPVITPIASAIAAGAASTNAVAKP